MLESSALYYRIASCFNFKSSIHFTTLPYCFIVSNAFIIIVPLHLLVFFYIEPSIYRVTCFADERQSCYYYDKYHALTLLHYILLKKDGYDNDFLQQNRNKNNYSVNKGYEGV